MGGRLLEPLEYKLREKKMRIVINYIAAEEKVAEVGRFSSQHFLPATISAFKVAQ